MNNEEGTQRIPCEDRGEGRQEVAPKDHARATGKDARRKEKEAALSWERLNFLLKYEPSTGHLIWKVKSRSNQIKVGDVAGTLSHFGYIAVQIDSKLFKAHRLVWFLEHKQWPVEQIDHINHVRSDNRLENLREAKRHENGGHQIQAHSQSKSKVLGVCWNKHHKRWVAKINHKGKRTYLGYYKDIEDAKDAYLTAKRRLHSHNTL